MGDISDKFITDCESKIIEAEDKSAFAEVGECFRAKLYKAGYILCWTVFAESLRQKIKQLADMGYNPAISENTRIEKLEKDHRSADVQIIDSAKTCELISDTEHTVCRTLWTKRCLFAHPYGTQATMVDCQDIIEKTIRFSMGRPVFLTKAMIEERLDDYIAHPHNVPDRGNEQIVLDSFFKLILPKNNNSLFQALFYRIRLRYEAGKHDIVFRFLVRMCYKLIVDRNLDLNDKMYRLDKGISDYPDTTIIVVSHPLIWQTLSDIKKGNLIKYYGSNKVLPIVTYQVRGILRAGIREPKNIEQIYYAKIKSMDISRFLDLYLDYDVMLNDIWDGYISGHRFVDQASFIDFLQDNEDAVTKFSAQQLRRIGSFVGFCCYTGTFRAQGFVSGHGAKWFENTDFVIGIVDGCLKSSDGKKIVFGAWTYGLNALRQLWEIDKKAIDSAIKDIQSTPADKSDFNYEYKRDSLKDTLAVYFDEPVLKEIHNTLSALLN